MINNYTSKSKQTFDEITRTLVKHHAKSVSYEYNDQGLCTALMFVIDVNGRPMPVKLPARYEKVKAIFDKAGRRYEEDQPYRTAWANIRDWVKAQLALVETEMVKMEEVFLPYFIDRNGKTFFESMENKNFLLGDGNSDK